MLPNANLFSNSYSFTSAAATPFNWLNFPYLNVLQLQAQQQNSAYFSLLANNFLLNPANTVEKDVNNIPQRNCITCSESELVKPNSSSSSECFTPMKNDDKTGHETICQFVVKVKGSSCVKSVAGYIAHLLRQSEYCSWICVLASGASAVNQAVKSIAVARKYIKIDGFDCIVKVECRNFSQQAVSLNLIRKKILDLCNVCTADTDSDISSSNCSDDESKNIINTDNGNTAELLVLHSSNPSFVAQLIALHIQAQHTTRLRCIGALAVNVSIRSIAFANIILTKENVKIGFQAQFSQILLKGGKKLCAIELSIVSL